MSLQSQIHSLVERLAEKFNGVDQRLGGLDRLETSAKANLVTAINEVAARTLSTTGVAYIHLQTAASAVWTVNHNLGLRPAVTILDSGGNEVEADVVHTSANQLLIRFAIPITGLARLT
jgi:hypothetical protein